MASGESRVSRRYDKENLLWQSTVAIKSDTVGSNNDFDKMDWYNVFHVGATYEPTFVEWLEGLKFSVVVDNLFDEEYCDYATYGTQYYPAAGCSFTFTVRYEF